MSAPGEEWSPAVQDAAAASIDSAAGPEGPPAASQRGDAPAPLASLSSLLGGSLEGGASCAADGTCD
ncbi:hypothetical protein [Brachybacterium sp.]|uniref:hypothetical protein n=1 Tax=Brachybacterium sp. TaxID=1891286 RepID=UPI003F90C8DC